MPGRCALKLSVCMCVSVCVYVIVCLGVAGNVAQELVT